MAERCRHHAGVGDDHVDALDMDTAFTRAASRLQMLSVIRRHSRAEEGTPSVATNSCSHSSAESSASSGPNNTVTALNHAVNSCSAMAATPAQSRSCFLGGSLIVS